MAFHTNKFPDDYGLLSGKKQTLRSTAKDGYFKGDSFEKSIKFLD